MEEKMISKFSNLYCKIQRKNSLLFCKTPFLASQDSSATFRGVRGMITTDKKQAFWDGLALYAPPGGSTLRSKAVSYQDLIMMLIVSLG